MLSRRHIPGEKTVHYQSARSKRPRPRPRMSPPLTPMIDVTFQLLIYFLLTTTFRQAEGQIPGTLPQAGGGPAAVVEKLKMPTRITLRPHGEGKLSAVFEIDGVAMNTADELYQALQLRKVEVGEDAPVVIKPRNDVRWKFVVEAFNQAVRAKFKNIAFTD